MNNGCQERFTGSVCIIFVVFSPLELDKWFQQSSTYFRNFKFGFLQFFGRLAILVQAIVFSTVQTITGYREGQPLSAQPTSVIWRVHVQFGLIPALFMLMAAIIFWRFYSLTPDKVKIHQDKIIELNL